MQNRLTCNQVSALLNFYVEDKQSKKLSAYIEQHLQSCPECMEKYIKMKSMLNKFMDIQNQEIENPYATKQYENFKTNLSAYIDNELNDLDNIKIKKIAISNPLARQDLENIYSFKKFLHSSFEKTKNEMKHDYSKSIISQIQHETTYYKRQDPFHKIITTFFLLITFLVTGLIIILYF